MIILLLMVFPVLLLLLSVQRILPLFIHSLRLRLHLRNPFRGSKNQQRKGRIITYGRRCSKQTLMLNFHLYPMQMYLPRWSVWIVTMRHILDLKGLPQIIMMISVITHRMPPMSLIHMQMEFRIQVYMPVIHMHIRRLIMVKATNMKFMLLLLVTRMSTTKMVFSVDLIQVKQEQLRRLPPRVGVV